MTKPTVIQQGKLEFKRSSQQMKHILSVEVWAEVFPFKEYGWLEDGFKDISEYQLEFFDESGNRAKAQLIERCNILVSELADLPLYTYNEYHGTWNERVNSSGPSLLKAKHSFSKILGYNEKDAAVKVVNHIIKNNGNMKDELQVLIYRKILEP